MPGSGPRLSGLNLGPLEHELIGVCGRCWFSPDEAVDTLSGQEVGAHEAGKGQGTLHGLLGGLGEAQEQESDQRDGDLDADGRIFRVCLTQRKNSSMAQRRL